MEPDLPDSVRGWRDGGRLVATPAGRVFVRSAAGRGPVLLLLHGFPSSSYDFRGLTDRLGDRGWLTLDFLGFGLSDMAGALSFELQRAVITNGSVIIERASLRPIQKILRGPLGPLAARLTNRRGFIRGFATLFSDAHPLSGDEASAQWALLAREDGQRILHLLSAYLHERVAFAERWHGAVRDWPKPLSLLWATDDPVATTAVLDGLRELRPAAEVVRLAGIGHYPQIEVPDEFTGSALRLLRLNSPAD